MNLVDIQKALILDEMADAIKGMLAYDSDHNKGKLSNQIIHQSGRYHANEKSNNIGTISSENYNRTKNQLRHALQQLLNGFPGYGPEILKEAQNAIMEAPNDHPKQGFSLGALKILMLTSNPVGTDKLQLRDEHSRISEKIENNDKFTIKSRWAVTTSEFTEALVDEKPNIVHFSGHGENQHSKSDTSETRRGQGFDNNHEEKSGNGIYLTDDDGRDPVFVSTEVIKHLFGSMIEINNVPIKIVVLNSCYSEAQAQALAEVVPHVIGTSSAIKDKAAIAFATGFYSFLTRNQSIKSAWNNGVTQALIKGEPKERFIYFENGKKVI